MPYENSSSNHLLEEGPEDLPQLTPREEKILDELVQNQPKIIGSLVKRGLSIEMAEDVAQEAFIKAQNSIRSFRGESSVYTWQYRIAFTTMLNMLKANKNRKDLHQPIEENNVNENGYVSEEFRSPFERVVSKDEIEKIRGEFEKLSEDHQKVIELSVDGKSTREIADILNIPESTVRTRKHYARRALNLE